MSNWAGGIKQGRSGKTSHFLVLNVNIGDTSKVTIMANDILLSIDTKIDDLAWPWPAISSNFVGISQDFADLGANNG